MSLVTESEFFYNYLKEDNPSSVDSNKKEFYNNMLSSAETFFLDEIDRELEQSTYNEKYCGSGTPFLVLKNYPIISLTSVSSLNVNDINIVDDEGLIYNSIGDFAEGRFNIPIEYEAGYAADNIPQFIKDAVGQLAKALVEETDHGSSRLNIELKESRNNRRTEYNTDVVPAITIATIEQLKDTRINKIAYVTV